MVILWNYLRNSISKLVLFLIINMINTDTSQQSKMARNLESIQKDAADVLIVN